MVGRSRGPHRLRSRVFAFERPVQVPGTIRGTQIRNTGSVPRSDRISQDDPRCDRRNTEYGGAGAHTALEKSLHLLSLLCLVHPLRLYRVYKKKR